MKNSIQLSDIDLSVAGLLKHYRAGDFSPRELCSLIIEDIKSQSHNPAFIYLLSLDELASIFSTLEAADMSSLPLYGVPFAIKDNIDLANFPTTAACAEFSYVPKTSAHVVQRLLEAGAIPIGKTNMDQFATGLVGVRSPAPWGPCKNTLNSEYISGGSSSGSAVAVANGWVSFSLGTDTAGSGRVPASLNNIVGLKPSCGVLSTTGVVPACKSIDCVSIFALSAQDANVVFDIAAHYDPRDAFARKNAHKNGARYFLPSAETFTFGLPKKEQLQFFGNKEAEALFDKAVTQLISIGGIPIEIDFSPFLNAAKLLYEGPWVTERFLVVRNLLENKPEAVLPVIKAIVESGGKIGATEVFTSLYQLNSLRQFAWQQVEKVDIVVTPTNGTAYTINEVLANPIELNSNLGYYTNFMNLLDFCAVAVPSGFYSNGVGFGITLFTHALNDKQLLSFASKLQNHTQLALGAKGVAYSAPEVSSLPAAKTVDVVVCGAHLEGLPLNWQLQERGAVKVMATHSAPAYKLFALAGGAPFRPAMIRDEKAGKKIEVEVWRVPAENFGSFVAEIPAPLGIGKVQLQDKRWLPGFICEAAGLDGAKEITDFGGWKGYLASIGG